MQKWELKKFRTLTMMSNRRHITSDVFVVLFLFGRLWNECVLRSRVLVRYGQVCMTRARKNPNPTSSRTLVEWGQMADSGIPFAPGNPYGHGGREPRAGAEEGARARRGDDGHTCTSVGRSVRFSDSLSSVRAFLYHFLENAERQWQRPEARRWSFRQPVSVVCRRADRRCLRSALEETRRIHSVGNAY